MLANDLDFFATPEVALTPVALCLVRSVRPNFAVNYCTRSYILPHERVNNNDDDDLLAVGIQ